MTRFGLSFLLICFWIPSVPASTPGGTAQAFTKAQVEQLFSDGKWQDAAHAGEMLGTADSLALAARAVLADAAYESGETTRLTAIARAMDLTERALTLDRTHTEALLQAAAAYGFRALILHSANDARQARRLLDRALFLAPANPYILAGLGTWHGNAVLEAGSFFARMFLGAQRASMENAFDAALAIAPDIASIRAGYGLLLLRFDKDAYYKRGLQHLRTAVTMTPHSAFERRLLNHASHLLAANDNGADQDKIRKMADAMAPFAGGPSVP